jgi:hypothetical protein
LFTTIVGSTCHAKGDEPSVILMFGRKGTSESGEGLAMCPGADRAIVDPTDPFETTNSDATMSPTKSNATSLNSLPRLEGIRAMVDNRFARDEVAAKD